MTINSSRLVAFAALRPNAARLCLLALLSIPFRGMAGDADQNAKDAGQAQAKAAADATKPAVRLITLKGSYLDHPPSQGSDPMSLLVGGLERPGSFVDLCDKIDEIAKDQGIQHVVFDISSPTLHLDLAQLSELSRHIQKLRGAGKRTFGWLENAGTIHYSIASACDTVLMTDLGSLDLPSLSMMTLHFRDAMDLLGAKASFVRTGDFKGAVEPFTLPEMSSQLREHYTQMLTSMNDTLVDQLCLARHLSRKEIRKIQSARLYTPVAAQEAKLVDSVVRFGSEREKVAELIGQEVNWIEPQKLKAKPLSFFELMGKLMGGGQERQSSKPAIAVLHLDGQIMDGESEMPGLLMSGPAVKAIEELESDDNVRAVVVRINSPGGSVSGSESIRAELEKLSKKKPVVVSMGNLAASGGYWISCLGRPVYAEAQTITGSIGVFALKLSLGPFLKKIGVKLESVTLDESAGAMSIDRGWTPSEEQRMQGFVDEIYDRFLSLVAGSRHLAKEQISLVAGGRVWSGAQALKLGLVDRIGGLDDSVSAAAREAGLESGYEVVHRPRKKNFFEMVNLFDESSEQIRSAISPTARAWLDAAGLELSVPLNLLRQSLSAQPAKLWLLAPEEISIR
jgi:protease-4